MKIADLRSELGLSLEAFAAQIGLQSRGRMSVIERENRCSLPVALRIEELSGGRVDAAEISEEVRAARRGLEGAENEARQAPPEAEKKSAPEDPGLGPRQVQDGQEEPVEV